MYWIVTNITWSDSPRTPSMYKQRCSILRQRTTNPYRWVATSSDGSTVGEWQNRSQLRPAPPCTIRQSLAARGQRDICAVSSVANILLILNIRATCQWTLYLHRKWHLSITLHRYYTPSSLSIIALAVCNSRHVSIKCKSYFMKFCTYRSATHATCQRWLQMQAVHVTCLVR